MNHPAGSAAARVLRFPRVLHVFALVAACTVATPPAVRAAGAASAASEGDAPVEDVTIMDEFKVSAERIEDFGFRVSPWYDPKRSALLWHVFTPAVDVLLPNTAAAKAGMRVGDRIVSSDGKSTASGSFSIRKWRRLQEAKWAAFAAGKKEVTWVLGVESEGTGEFRRLELKIPTASPRWGAEVWRRPEGRPPAAVTEPGPLAARAEDVLENGIGVLLRGSYIRGLGLTVAPERVFLLGCQWTLWDGDAGHRMFVTQQNGRTEIVLEAITRETGAKLSKNAPASGPERNLASPTTVFARDSRAYLTAPDGTLRAAWMLPRSGRQCAVPPELAAVEFVREKEFWLRRVSRDAPRWPMVLIPASGPAPATAVGSVPATPAKPTVRDAAFLKLRRATDAERVLLDAAFAQLGADADRWAFTETSRTIEDPREIEVRVDPSKPETERCALRRIDGRAATAEEIRRWAEEEHEASDPDREYETLRAMVDRSEVRVAAEDADRLVFELPVQDGLAEVPAEKFQAVFRVNRATRAFESVEVKLRESFRVAGGMSVAEAGLAMAFRTVDPAGPPQLEMLRGGGAIRVLLKEFSRDFALTRTDFVRVEPYAAPAPPAAE